MSLSVFPVLLQSFCLRAGLFGEAAGWRALWRVLLFLPSLTDNSFETNQTLNKKKQVICLSCSWMQTRAEEIVLFRNSSLHQPPYLHVYHLLALSLEGQEGGNQAEKGTREERRAEH